MKAEVKKDAAWDGEAREQGGEGPMWQMRPLLGLEQAVWYSSILLQVMAFRSELGCSWWIMCRS
jgi:hypothetical protein